MKKCHHYTTTVTWTGNQGKGTARYDAYARDYEITTANKPTVASSSDPAFRGDPTRWTPEEQLLSSVSGCHMLWYLHLCAVNEIVVLKYIDHAEAEMHMNDDGSGQFSRVILRPTITVDDDTMVENALALHARANEMCFIARSVNFPVTHQPKIVVRQPA